MGVLILWNLKDFAENVTSILDMTSFLAIVKDTIVKQGMMTLAML